MQFPGSSHRRLNIARNLALTRKALLAIIPWRGRAASGWFEIYQRNPATAIRLILHTAPVQ